jgi:hypothetical protein
MRFRNGYDKGFFVIMPDGESIWMTELWRWDVEEADLKNG